MNSGRWGSLILGDYCWGEVGPRMALIGFVSGSLSDAPCLIRCVELVLNTRREVPFWGRSVGERLRKFPPCGMDSLMFFFSFSFFFQRQGSSSRAASPRKSKDRICITQSWTSHHFCALLEAGPLVQPTPGKETPQDMEVRITGPPWRLPAYGNV